MEKLTRILKNVALFLIVFLSINYFLSSCQNNEQVAGSNNNIVFTTTKSEYSKVQLVTVDLKNNTEKELVIKNECPEEPFNVFRYENNEWVQKTSKPELNCDNATDIAIPAGKDRKITYENWNNALFSEMGRFKIEFETEIDGETKTISTNDFQVVKEGIIKQIWNGIFFRPIYNGLMFLTSVLPEHSLGLAIILLTLIIRTILLIPSQKAMKAQKRMQEIQPRLEKIKEKHKGDQQRIAMETMALWKEAKASPMGSCLPLFLQIPFLIALFYTVKMGLNPDNTHLLYTVYNGFSLHDIGTNFLGILDLTKPNLYVLPIIVGGLQFAQMKLSMLKNSKKDTKKNEMAMATNETTKLMTKANFHLRC